MSSDIASAAKEQSTATGGMNNSLETINQASDQIFSDSRLSVETSNELQALVVQLQSMIKQFNP